MAIQENGAGIYFPMDADEFIHLNVSLDEFKRQIDSLPDNSSLNIPLLNMAFPEDVDDELFSDAPKSFGLLQNWAKTKGLDAKMLMKISDPGIANQLTLMQGNHVFFRNNVLMKKDFALCDSIRFIHVPVRSPEQAFRKFVCGWLSNVQKFGRNSVMATHWKIAFDKICEEDFYANSHLAYLLNSIYIGNFDIEKDFDAVDAKSIFKYELAYGDMRKKGLGVALRNIESDFESIFLKMSQKT
jgi:hypothetical protein